MSSMLVREVAARPRFSDTLGADLVVSKLRPPSMRSGTVRRALLVERLARADRGPLVSVVAPAGYGKTTLLAQWAERNGQAFAWVSVDDADNDPKVLLTYVAEALDAVQPVGGRVFDALASPTSSVPGSVVPRLCAAFSAMTTAVVLVLDDVHTLLNSACRAALSALADHVPAGSRLVLAGRTEPLLRTGRRRAEGRLLEIGPADLALSLGEAASLLANAGVTLGEAEVAELHHRTEGWPAGLYLAALSLQEGGPLRPAARSFTGGDRFVSDYLESEFLARISPGHRAFLTHTAVLERMSGPLCDAVLGQHRSAATLAELAQSNLLLVPLDRHNHWYRYHHLFRDMLLTEMHRQQPHLMPIYQERAAEWFENNGAPEQALEYWMKAGDVAGAARLVGALAFATYQRGRAATVQRWFGWLEDHADMANYPAVAILAAAVSAVTGNAADAGRWAKAAERGAGSARPPDGSRSIESWLALLRALLCRDGVEKMTADAEIAAATIATGSFWRATPILLRGMAHVMADDPGRADLLFEDAVAEARAAGGPTDACVALAERSLLAIAKGAWDVGEQHLFEAKTVARDANLEDYPPITILYAAAARIALHRTDLPRARAQLTRAQRLRPALTYALPHLAVQARLELARCHLALADFAAAQIHLREVDQILARRPSLGAFVRHTEDLREELSHAWASSAAGASALTDAELRLLPMLSTHLSFPEIAKEMFLSRHTVKSEATSLYRKLGVSSRSQAVARARELSLLDN